MLITARESSVKCWETTAPEWRNSPSSLMESHRAGESQRLEGQDVGAGGECREKSYDIDRISKNALPILTGFFIVNILGAILRIFIEVFLQKSRKSSYKS
jgi:hypothetical protein